MLNTIYFVIFIKVNLAKHDYEISIKHYIDYY